MSGFSTTGASVGRRHRRRSRARWRCGGRSPRGSAASGSSCCSSPCCRACASAAARRCSRPSRRGPELALATTIRESAQRFVVLYVGITAAEVAILTGFGFTGVDPRMTFYNAVAHLVHDDRDGGLLARAALDRAVRARLAVGDRRLHARRGDELRAALRGHRRPAARRLPPRRGVPDRARAVRGRVARRGRRAASRRTCSGARRRSAPASSTPCR